ncbi:unnamed protein product [Brugia timori]|uniref:Uncharacterized protein n=1 Tax=Brugia timori TaxID=42155 RepID=A0A3P7W1P1_9BILA|nr:unnamed protein product [Brugia timori]
MGTSGYHHVFRKLDPGWQIHYLKWMNYDACCFSANVVVVCDNFDGTVLVLSTFHDPSILLNSLAQ